MEKPTSLLTQPLLSDPMTILEHVVNVSNSMFWQLIEARNIGTTLMLELVQRSDCLIYGNRHTYTLPTRLEATAPWKAHASLSVSGQHKIVWDSKAFFQNKISASAPSQGQREPNTFSMSFGTNSMVTLRFLKTE